MKISFVFIILFVLPGAVFSSEPAASVRDLLGKAFILRKFREIPLAAGVALEDKDHVYTGRNSFVCVALKFGDLLSLGPSSHFKLSRLDEKGGGEIVLIDGVLRLNAACLDGSGGYLLKTPAGLIDIRETSDLLCQYTRPQKDLLSPGVGKAIVTVLQGRVAIVPSAIQDGRGYSGQVVLRELQKLEFTAGMEGAEPSTLSAKDRALFQAFFSFFAAESAGQAAGFGAQGHGAALEIAKEAAPLQELHDKRSRLISETEEANRSEMIDQVEANLKKELRSIRIPSPVPGSGQR